jgi:hypothetical protein
MMLHLQTVESRKGLVWIRHGLQIYRRRPLALTALYAAAAMLGLLLEQLPEPLEWLALMLPPLVSLGFMLATHAVLQGQAPTVAVYLAPFKITRDRRNSQLLLCLSYGVLLSLAFLLAQWIDGGAFDHLQGLLSQDKRDEQAVLAALGDPHLFWGLVVALLALSLLSIPFWHAPALVHWAGQGLAQALFSSTLALWRNRAAFALSMLGWLGLGFSLSLVVGVLGALLGGAATAFLTVLAGMWLTTAFYASLYFCFVDCFMFSPDEIKV